MGDFQDVQRRTPGAHGGHVVFAGRRVVAGEQHAMTVDVEQQHDAVGVCV